MDVARGLGRLGKCKMVRGDVGLAGEIGSRIPQRLEGPGAVKEALSLLICGVE